MPMTLDSLPLELKRYIVLLVNIQDVKFRAFPNNIVKRRDSRNLVIRENLWYGRGISALFRYISLKIRVQTQTDVHRERVNKEWSDLAAAHLFQTILSRKCKRSIWKYTLSSKYGRHVRHITFEPEDDCELDTCRTPAIRACIEHAQSMINLESVTLCYGMDIYLIDDADDDESADSDSDCSNEESAYGRQAFLRILSRISVATIRAKEWATIYEYAHHCPRLVRLSAECPCSNSDALTLLMSYPRLRHLTLSTLTSESPLAFSPRPAFGLESITFTAVSSLASSKAMLELVTCLCPILRSIRIEMKTPEEEAILAIWAGASPGIIMPFLERLDLSGPMSDLIVILNLFRRAPLRQLELNLRGKKVSCPFDLFDPFKGTLECLTYSDPFRSFSRCRSWNHAAQRLQAQGHRRPVVTPLDFVPEPIEFVRDYWINRSTRTEFKLDDLCNTGVDIGESVARHSRRLRDVGDLYGLQNFLTTLHAVVAWEELMKE